MRHQVQAQSATLAQHQAVTDEVLRLRAAPVVQMLHDQPAQDHLYRNRRPTRLRGVWSAPFPISFDLLKELIALKHPIRFRQLWLEAQLQRGYQREQIDGRGPIS
jgi:hypothetical protein